MSKKRAALGVLSAKCFLEMMVVVVVEAAGNSRKTAILRS